MSDDLVRTHAHFFAEDLEWIEKHYGETIGTSKFLRLAAHRRVAELRKRLAERLPLPDMGED